MILQKILEALSSDAVVKAFDNFKYIIIGVSTLVALLKSKKVATVRISVEKRKGICSRSKKHIPPR